MMRDFESEEKVVLARFEADPFVAAHDLRSLHEAWARSLLHADSKGSIATVVRRRVKAGLDPLAAEQAAIHLADAEKWQRKIGTFATGAGEGLMSMDGVRAYQTARAWLAAGLSRHNGKSAQARVALSLASKVEKDSNGMGAPYAKSLEELRTFLTASSRSAPRRG